jgi:hydroxymethylpyrimidine kinase/phosphomethylpyrimidine kinase
MKTVLTIAGFDPSGGAGVLADIKTFAAFGCFGAAGITSITSQNTHGVLATFHHSADRLRSQLVPVLEDYQIAAVKIGMLPTRELVEDVAELLAEYSLRNIVLDPVLQSSSGHLLIDSEAISYLCAKLMPRVDLLTPNLAEAAIFFGERPQTLDEMKVAAQQIGTTLVRDKTIAVLVKGGHLQDEATDVLFDGQTLHEFTTPKISSRHTHGTGCTLSSAIAALLAQDVALPDAVRRAKEFVTEAIRHAPGIGHGAGPLHHFFAYAPNSPTH